MFKKNIIRERVMQAIDEHLSLVEAAHEAEQDRLERSHRENIEKLEREHFDKKAITTENYVAGIIGKLI